MFGRIGYSVLICLFAIFSCFGQEKIGEVEIVQDTIVKAEEIDPLSPSRAAFYSAVLPGLGQAYNKKYWKVPIVWLAIGTGIYFYADNKDSYDRYQTAFKLRESGRDDEFNGEGDNPNISTDGLIRAQKTLKKNMDLSLFITLGLYGLNIIEANVDAHLDDKAFSRDLSFKPSFYIDPVNNQWVTGINLKYNF